MFRNTIIYGVKVPDIERVIGMSEIGIEVVGEQRVPSVISKMNQCLLCITKLGEQIIFFNGRPGKIRPGIYKCRERACSQAFQTLQRSGGWVGDEGSKEGIVGCRRRGFVQDGEAIVVVLDVIAGNGEVVTEGVDYNYNRLVKLFWVPAAIFAIDLQRRLGTF